MTVLTRPGRASVPEIRIEKNIGSDGFLSAYLARNGQVRTTERTEDVWCIRISSLLKSRQYHRQYYMTKFLIYTDIGHWVVWIGPTRTCPKTDTVPDRTRSRSNGNRPLQFLTAYTDIFFFIFRGIGIWAYTRTELLCNTFDTRV